MVRNVPVPVAAILGKGSQFVKKWSSGIWKGVTNEFRISGD